jgi:hypothetical protein
MKTDPFVKLVTMMRMYQKLYIRFRTESFRRNMKRYERKIDQYFAANALNV